MVAASRCAPDHRAERASARLLLGLTLVFVVVHAAYYRVGVTFDADPLQWYWQYLDEDLLRTDLLRSLVYLHAQPPLFNLLLGLVVKTSGKHADLLCQLIYLVAGWGLYTSQVLVMRRLGVGTVLAVGLGTAFLISPSFMLYEHWLLYTFPLASMLSLSALLLLCYLREGRMAVGIGLFSVLALLGGTAALFQLGSFLLVLVALVVFRPDRRRAMLRDAVAPGLLLLALHLKNLAIFGIATTSSWAGMNFARVTVQQVPLEDRARLVTAGRLSAVALVRPFSGLFLYPRTYLDRVDTFPDVPALRRESKAQWHSNYNHVAYIGISRQYLADALTTVRLRPGAFLQGLRRSWLTYFKSTSDYEYLSFNRPRLHDLTELWDTTFYGRVRSPVGYEERGDSFLYVVLLGGLPALWGVGVWRGIRLLHHRDGAERDRGLVMLYMCGTIAYVALVGNVVEAGENNRFRFMTDPLSIVLLGVLVQWRLESRRARPLGQCAPEDDRRPISRDNTQDVVARGAPGFVAASASALTEVGCQGRGGSGEATVAGGQGQPETDLPSAFAVRLDTKAKTA